MPRIKPIDYDAAPPDVKAAHDAHLQHQGRITNMKRTLLNSLPAFHALMEWYPLRDAVLPFLGERLTNLYAWAISTTSDCLICSTFFRRIFTNVGEDPDDLQLDEREQTVVAFGRQLAVDANAVSDELYARLSEYFEPAQIVTLTAFGGLMIATNVFNNALEVDLDGYLEPYLRRQAAGVGA